MTVFSIDCASFKPKSDFTPPANRDRQLDAYITAVKNAIMTGAFQTRPDDFHHNLTRDERLSIKNIKSFDDIVIKDADKGSCVVIMDRSRYIQEAERHLNDTATYCKLDTDPTSIFYKDIEACVLQLEQQGIFSKVMRDFALITDSCTVLSTTQSS